MAELVVLYLGPIVTLTEAKEQNLKRYFTGNACTNGHVDQYYTSSRNCCACADERNKVSRKDHPDRQPRYAKVHRERLKRENPEEWERRRSREREYKKRNYVKAVLTPEELEAERIRGREKWSVYCERVAGSKRPDICDVCGDSAVGRIELDHCHQTGKFRGWLCARCNRTLGFVKDFPKLLRELAVYLEQANGSIDNKTQERIAIKHVRGA